MQCIANSDASRCSRPAKDQTFCVEHGRQFYTKYKKYKQLDAQSQHMMSRIKRGTVEDCIRTYGRLEKAYVKRREFRAIAIHPTAYDDGHDIRIKMLWQQMEHCVNLIKRKCSRLNVGVAEVEKVAEHTECTEHSRPHRPRQPRQPRQPAGRASEYEHKMAAIRREEQMWSRFIPLARKEWEEYESFVDTHMLAFANRFDETLDCMKFCFYMIAVMTELVRIYHPIMFNDCCMFMPVSAQSISSVSDMRNQPVSCYIDRDTLNKNYINNKKGMKDLEAWIIHISCLYHMALRDNMDGKFSFHIARAGRRGSLFVFNMIHAGHAELRILLDKHNQPYDWYDLEARDRVINECRSCEYYVDVLQDWYKLICSTEIIVIVPVDSCVKKDEPTYYEIIDEPISPGYAERMQAGRKIIGLLCAYIVLCLCACFVFF